MRILSRALVVAAATVAIAGTASAKPIGPQIFCDQYPASPLCASGPATCQTCHLAPPERNEFGAAIAENLLPGVPRPLTDEQYSNALPGALLAVEELDSDGDAHGNLVEIDAGTQPGDAFSFPLGDADCVSSNPTWDVCGYDRKYVWKKIHLDFCGYSPSLEDLDYFDTVPALQQDAMIDDAMDVCVDTDFWAGRDGILWQLANRKIRPLATFQQPGVLEYENDYNLFAWSQIDGNDARAVLTANFYVTRNESVSPTTYSVVSDLPDTESIETARRAGLLTSRWTLFYNTMFTALPRTTAAQAYRAFLGTDIARMEGLYPIANEPVDYDAKGVTAAGCAACHSTLDPLTYPFTNYNGIGPGPAVQYVDDRLATFYSDIAPNIGNTPEAGYIFGQPVADLSEWAEVAANSPQFADATVKDYWKLLMGRDPLPEEMAEFNALSSSFRTTDAYSVEAMLHKLVKTEAYGAP